MAIYSRTQAQLRQTLSRRNHDLELVTCEAGSDATHFVSSYLLGNGKDDYYNTWEAHAYEGTNIGNTREITDWVHADKKATLAPAFSSALDITSKLELHRECKVAELNDFLNEAIDMVAKEILFDIVNETVVLVADTREYALPLTIIEIDRITREYNTAGIYKMDDVIDPRDYKLLHKFPPKLWLADNWSPLAGRHLRIEGRASQDRLTSDGDICALPPVFVVQQALAFYQASRATAEHTQMLVAAQAMADRARYRHYSRSPSLDYNK